MTNEQRTTATKLSNKGVELAYAYVTPLGDEQRQIYVFEMNASNIGNFLGKHQFDVDNIIITDIFDELVLNTFGGFINRCPNQTFCHEVLDVLVPIQMGEKEAKEIEMLPLEIMDEFWNE